MIQLDTNLYNIKLHLNNIRIVEKSNTNNIKTIILYPVINLESLFDVKMDFTKFKFGVESYYATQNKPPTAVHKNVQLYISNGNVILKVYDTDYSTLLTIDDKLLGITRNLPFDN